MSSSPLIVLMALTSLLVLPGAAAQAAQTGSAADLLLKDELQQAETLLAKQPRTAETVALRGEVEFRKGNFAQADALYKEAVRMDAGVVTAPETPAPIRFQKALHLLFTKLTTNGHGPYNFAIDTGATQTVISEKLVAETSLQPITSTVVYGIGGAGKVETKLYAV